MSMIFGHYRQNGYVVPDLDAAIDRWVEVGVGPFYRLDSLPIANFAYRGSTVSPALNVALGNFGDVQIELIHQLGSTPSPYLDFLATHPEGGLHHISAWSDDFDADVARCATRGLTPDCTGEVEGFARFCYFRSTSTDGTAIEIADTGTSELFRQVCGLIHDAARTWDGARPKRGLDELSTLLGK